MYWVINLIKHNVMTGLEKIKNILTGISEAGNLGYYIEYEADDFMNIKADDIKRSDKVVQLREIYDGQYIATRGRYRHRRANLQIYFFWFIDFLSQAGKGDTWHSETTENVVRRQEIRDAIEAEIVFPFISAFDDARRRGEFYNTDYQVGFVYPPTPLYDANECGILLNVQLDEIICP